MLLNLRNSQIVSLYHVLNKIRNKNLVMKSSVAYAIIKNIKRLEKEMEIINCFKPGIEQIVSLKEKELSNTIKDKQEVFRQLNSFIQNNEITFKQKERTYKDVLDTEVGIDLEIIDIPEMSSLDILELTFKEIEDLQVILNVNV